MVHAVELRSLVYTAQHKTSQRREVDQTHYLTHSQQPQQREEEIMTGSGCGAVEMTGINVVDVGKLLAAKPSREKRSVSEEKVI